MICSWSANWRMACPARKRWPCIKRRKSTIKFLPCGTAVSTAWERSSLIISLVFNSFWKTVRSVISAATIWWRFGMVFPRHIQLLILRAHWRASINFLAEPEECFLPPICGTGRGIIMKKHFRLKVCAGLKRRWRPPTPKSEAVYAAEIPCQTIRMKMRICFLMHLMRCFRSAMRHSRLNCMGAEFTNKKNYIDHTLEKVYEENKIIEKESYCLFNLLQNILNHYINFYNSSQ